MAWKTILGLASGLITKWSPLRNQRSRRSNTWKDLLKVSDGVSDSSDNRKISSLGGIVLMGLAGAAGTAGRQKGSVGGEEGSHAGYGGNDRGAPYHKGAVGPVKRLFKSVREVLFLKKPEEVKESRDFWRARGKLNRVLQEIANDE